jgi:hypothetical protein
VRPQQIVRERAARPLTKALHSRQPGTCDGWSTLAFSRCCDDFVL